MPWFNFDKRPKASLVVYNETNKIITIVDVEFDYDGQPEILDWKLRNSSIELLDCFTIDGIVKFDIKTTFIKN